MKPSVIIAGLLASAILAASSLAAPGQSAAITLVFPYGARSCGMGEIGTALADDESVLFYNPAGLAVPNHRFRGGVKTSFREDLLPAFHLPDLYHTAFASNYQHPDLWVQPGVFRNFINMGTNTWTDELGRELGSAESYEEIWAVGFGFALDNIGIRNHYVGLTFKYINSALAPGLGPDGEGVGRDFAFDFGYLWTLPAGFRFGTTFMNMGPPIYYTDPEKSNPLPFTVNLALGWKRRFDLNDNPFLALAAESRLEREFVHPNDSGPPDPFYRALTSDWDRDSLQSEMREIVRHFGVEATLFNTLSIRLGSLVDIIGSRFESTSGLGFALFNHVAFDFSRINSPEGYGRGRDPNGYGSTGARNGQQRFSLTLYRLFEWHEEDWTWWRTPPR